MFGSRGEHPVRLETPAGHEVVHQDTDIALVAAKDDGARPIARSPHSHQRPPLGARLFIAGRPVDLTCEDRARPIDFTSSLWWSSSAG